MQQYGGELAQWTLDGATEYLYHSFFAIHSYNGANWKEGSKFLCVSLEVHVEPTLFVRPVVKFATFTDIF